MTIVIPEADVRLTKEDGQPSDAWYPIFLLWAAAFNALGPAIEEGLEPKATKVGQTDAWDGCVLVAANQAYPLVQKSAKARTITEATFKSSSGTCTATLDINGVPLGGGANSVSSVEQSIAHSSANELAEGDTLTLTISANSTALNVSFSIKYDYDLI